MASFNKVILMGNLTRDPDVRLVGSGGSKVARMRIAVSERRKDRNGVSQEFPLFVDVDAWDRSAELCGQYLAKGSLILVEGRLQQDSWERDGVKHQHIKVRATAIKFLTRADRPQQGYDRAARQPEPPMESVPQDIEADEPLPF